MTKEKLSKDWEKIEAIPLADKAIQTKEDLEKTVPKLQTYKILIEVVNDIEFKTAMCQMNGTVHYCDLRDDITGSTNSYFYGKWGKVPVVLVQTGKIVGSQFQHGSWFATKKALYYMPQLQYVFGVGVCGAAVDDNGSGELKSRVPLGHIVVSSFIFGYDHLRKGKFDESKGYKVDLREKHFYQYMTRSIDKGVWEKIVHCGTVLSGSWLVANEKAQKSVLQSTQSNAIAFEMEGVGIAAACENKPNVKCCMVVKGVSDYANEDKNDHWQPAAARNAACFLLYMMNKKVMLRFKIYCNFVAMEQLVTIYVVWHPYINKWNKKF